MGGEPTGGMRTRGAAPRGRLRQYELIREIGRGGMGTVFLARDTKLARRVAIKFLSDVGVGVAERFLVEARATARCTHENIVVIHEVDEAQGQPYMVLEYLEGATLREALAGGAMPASRAVEILVPVVRALARAHEFGIVHRDLKPENVFLTSDGRVKVLDFGVAKALAPEPGAARPAIEPAADGDLAGALLTDESALVGTAPYMAPEQWGADDIDHRADLWAAGIVLFEMLAGAHPLAPATRDRVRAAAVALEAPMPRLADAVAGVDAELDAVVARCLRKRKQERFAGAEELLAALEPHLPRRRASGVEKSPYPGLAAFREEDADLFCGRAAETARLAARLIDRPLLGVVGPSGAGKSSLVRAGLIPELKRTERWDACTTRPGRQPLAALAAAALGASSATGRREVGGAAELAARLRGEPGALGEALRARARARGMQVLLFVDQFEELYTLTEDAAVRRAALAALAGAADDAASPVRVVVSLRSDFLDRVSQDGRFIEELTPGLLFLAPPGPEGLRAALLEPAAYAGYRFEEEAIADEMVAELGGATGALPLLQFAASRLWDLRDRKARRLTRAAYRAIGGVGGALASHADAVVGGLPASAEALVRRVLLRLVTPERTRDVVEVEELLELGGDDRAAVQKLLDHLVDARLLSVRAAPAPNVELVHESLIATWPALQRWLDQSHEDAAFLAQLRTAARQWDDGARAGGLLWRGEPADAARQWAARGRGELGRRERDYLDAVLRLADRATRVRRFAVAGTIALLALLVVAASIALVWIRGAEREARRQADHARAETERARAATAQVEAEKERQVQLVERLEREQVAREAARAAADQASQDVELGRRELERTNVQLRDALAGTRAQSQRAQSEAERALTAQAAADQQRQVAEQERLRAEELARRERERADRLEKQRGKRSTVLK